MESVKPKQAAVKSLWHLSGEAVLRNQLLPPGLLTAVRDPPPFPWLSSSSSLKVERTTHQRQGTKEERKEEGRGEEVVLPEEVKETLQRLQRRCDVCAQLFLETEAEVEEEEKEEAEEGQAREVVRRHWDKERRVWWELLCCSQSCFHQPLPAACSLAPK